MYHLSLIMSILTNTLFTILPIFIFVFYAIYTKKTQKKMFAIEHLFSTTLPENWNSIYKHQLGYASAI